MLDFGLPNPVGMIESAINAKLERKVAEDALSLAYSSTISFLWGLRKAPLVGQAFGLQAVAMLMSLQNSQLYQDGNIRLTVPKSILDPDLDSKFETECLSK